MTLSGGGRADRHKNKGQPLLRGPLPQAGLAWGCGRPSHGPRSLHPNVAALSSPSAVHRMCFLVHNPSPQPPPRLSHSGVSSPCVMRRQLAFGEVTRPWGLCGWGPNEPWSAWAQSPLTGPASARGPRSGAKSAGDWSGGPAIGADRFWGSFQCLYCFRYTVTVKWKSALLQTHLSSRKQKSNCDM